MIPTYAKISIEQVIARAKIACNCENSTEHDSFFNIMIMEAMGELKILSQLIKRQCRITITEGRADLPVGFVQFLAMRGHCRQWTEEELENNPMLTNSNYGNVILYCDTTFLNSCGCNTNGWNNWLPNVQINGNYIHFNDHTSLTHADLAFMGLDVDENGNQIILQRYEVATSLYATWKYAEKYPAKYTQYQIASYQQQWIAKAARLKGEDVATGFRNDKFQIGGVVNSLLTSPLVNIYP